MHVHNSWREPPSPASVLTSCEWLAPADALDPQFTICSLSSSHAVFRVTSPDGRSVVVKQLRRETADAGRSLVRELYVYRMAGWIPELSATLPKALLIDEDQQVLVLQSLAVGRQWPDPEEDDTSIGSSGVGTQLGYKMGLWQRATERVSLFPSSGAGILHLPDALSLAQEGRPDSTQKFMRSIAEDGALANALREGLSLYRNRCLVHGDIRRDNWSADRSGRGLDLKVLDWELSGSGDPAWDIGSIMAEAFLGSMRRGVAIHPETKSFPPGTAKAIREFFQGYASSRGLVDMKDDAELRRVVVYTIARLLHIGCEWADSYAETQTGPVSEVFYLAHNLLREREKFGETLESLL